MSDRSQLDGKVLAHLRAIEGSTAWAMHGAIGESRETVSNSCQRLKRKGLVSCNGSYWRAAMAQQEAGDDQ